MSETSAIALVNVQFRTMHAKKRQCSITSLHSRYPSWITWFSKARRSPGLIKYALFLQRCLHHQTGIHIKSERMCSIVVSLVFISDCWVTTLYHFFFQLVGERIKNPTILAPRRKLTKYTVKSVVFCGYLIVGEVCKALTWLEWTIKKRIKFC